MMNILKLKKTKILFTLFIIFTVLCYSVLEFQIDLFKICFSSKIWAHRVNSIEKYQEAKMKFSGIETDIVFESSNNYFDVNHPPAKSIGLKLQDLLNSNEKKSEFGVWLDFKNLDSTNQNTSLIKLGELMNILKIESRLILIESSSPQYLRGFTENGFKTSFYLPPNVLNLSSKDLNEFLKFTNNLLNTKSIECISSSSNHYDFMKKYFPDTRKFTWILNEPPKIRSLYTLKRSYINFRKNLSIFMDPNVEAILLPFKSKTGNR